MKKAMTPALVFFLSIAASIARAQSGSGPEWITGKITSIYEDEDGALISLEMADGEPYNVSVTNKGFIAGDVVTVQVVRGCA